MLHNGHKRIGLDIGHLTTTARATISCSESFLSHDVLLGGSQGLALDGR